MMLKISDVANHVGVSMTTVSYVLNDKPEASRISEKTRRKILDAAEELGYRSNSLARAIRTGNTKMLGVLGGRTEEEHVGRILAGALEAADDCGYTLKLLRLHAIGSAQQVIRRSSELRLTGILALHLPEQVLDELQVEANKSGTPLVLMDTYSENPDVIRVISDDEASFAIGVDHLVKLGHSKIALLNGGGGTPIGTARKRAFEYALAHHALKLPPDYCVEGSYHRRDPSLEAARSLLTLPIEDRPTAIFCVSDLIALATLRVALELGIKVPSQLSVIGFANMKAAEFAFPALTTIYQPFEEIGRTAVAVLQNIISERLQEQNGDVPAITEARKQTQTATYTNFLPTRLIERDSTAPPPR